MRDSGQLMKPEAMNGKTVDFAVYVGSVPDVTLGCTPEVDLVIRFSDETFAIIGGYGNDCYGGAQMDTSTKDVHRHALGLMTVDEALAYEAKIAEKERTERAINEREFERLRAKLGR